MTPYEFAVIDLETTGLSPAHHHRVLEVAIVILDSDGKEKSVWNTLINPQRHVSASHIHGITAGDLFGAPTFEDIAGEITQKLQGRVLTAHNLAFDSAFLIAEFKRLGVPVAWVNTGGLCTMQMASRYLNPPSRSLQACCSLIDHSISTSHSALDDAKASAALLRHYLSDALTFKNDWESSLSGMASLEWPTLPTYGVAPVVRQHGNATDRVHFLARLATRATVKESIENANSYLELLDRILLDREISLHEEAELVSAALSLGLSREDAIHCHRVYLSSLAKIALEDATLTTEERNELDSVAQLLGLTSGDVDAALVHPGPEEVDQQTVKFSLSPGDSIVFTGDAPGIDRANLEQQAKSLGFKTPSSVSKKTRLVVAADPDSLSGKAQKARSLEIPIIGYPFYFRLIEQYARSQQCIT